MKVKVLLAAFLSIALLVSGCAVDSNPTIRQGSGSVEAHLKISSNFGRDILFDGQIEIPQGTSALEALQMYADAGTAYGGGFVTSVEGIKSGYLETPASRQDWFLYVNGILARSGGLGYEVHAGDTIHWYFRDWSFRQSVSAIVGDFPEPFVHGYAGTAKPVVILYEDGFYKQAVRLSDSLEEAGVRQVNIRSNEEISSQERESYNLLVLGSVDFEPLGKIWDIWDRVGQYARFEDAKIQTYDLNGKPEQSYSSDTGLVLAMQNPFNPRGTGACENVLWVVSGTDSAGVGQAVDLLTTLDNNLNCAAGIVFSSGQAVFVP